MRADIVIVGAGPAGAFAALALAPRWRVLVVERSAGGSPRVGESLIPAARRLFRDVGLLASFEAEGHAPWYGNVSSWGGVGEVDFVRDPDGPGWHLDRARFDAWLLAEARARGAVVLRPASVLQAERGEGGWRLRVGFPDDPGELEVHARAVLDAGGRASRLGPMLGGVRTVDDRLVAGWRHGRGGGEARSAVFAEPDGWWYTAPLPDNRRVLSFQTDADLPAAADARDPERLLARARGVPGLDQLVGDTEWEPGLPAAFVAAHSAALAPAAGPGWAAAGDAALAFDPLSSRGIFNALYTGFAAAEALDRGLAGGSDAEGAYLQVLARVRASYQRERVDAYAAETRWAERAFWGRRVRAGVG